MSNTQNRPLSPFRSFLPFFIFLIFLSLSPVFSQEEIDAKEIINRVDQLLRGDSSHGTVEMKVVTKRWKRTLSLEIWSEGTEKALIRILKPKKEEGTATLKVGADIWNYLPKIDRTIRVPSSMMMGAWMGSHFTNDDLVKESQLVRDYDVELTFKGERDSVPVYEFTLTPHPDAPVVWGSMEYRVRSDDLMPIWAKYYDEKGTLKRNMTFHDFKKMGGRVVPTLMKLVPAEKPEEYTQMLYHSLEFNIEIPNRMFSLSSLRR
jgi:hypothetical protein